MKIKSDFVKEYKGELLILLGVSIFGLLIMLLFLRSNKLMSDAVYSVSHKVELYQHSKSGKQYEYAFQTKNGHFVIGKIFINSLFRNSVNVNVDSVYYVAYSKSNPELNVLLIDKICCDSTLLYTKVKKREWSIWDM